MHYVESVNHPISDVLWWFGSFVLVAFALFLALDLLQVIRQKRSYSRWLREQGRGALRGESGPGPYRVDESSHPLRARFARRIQAGFESLRSRGLGQPPWMRPDEWSPLDAHLGRHKPE